LLAGGAGHSSHYNYGLQQEIAATQWSADAPEQAPVLKREKLAHRQRYGNPQQLATRHYQ
jgi:hypothetical protein